MPRSSNETQYTVTSKNEMRSAIAMIACAPPAHATPCATFFPSPGSSADTTSLIPCRMSDREVQVAPEHYDFERYDDAERWMSYWHQLRAVLSVRPKTVLEIGPGSGVFRNYLRAAGVTVKTLDIDPTREVDYVADITKLDAVLPAGMTFDAICAFQVLEHLPFAEFETCLQNIAKRASPHVSLIHISEPTRRTPISYAV